MDTLKAMQVFVEVARRGGFAAAATVLNLSTSSVSRHVANLEDWLGTQLFIRTTRHLRLTETGKDLLAQCARIVHDIDDIANAHRLDSATPKGRLRMTMPPFLGDILMEEVVAQFAIDHPEVDIDVLLDSRLINLVEEGFDLAVRVGLLSDSTLVARKFLDLHLVLIASPDYLARRGRPVSPEDLSRHNCIIDDAAPYRDRWPLAKDGAVKRVRIKGNITVNSGAAARDLAAGGAGLTLLPEYLVFDDIEAGRLVPVLEDCAIDYGGAYIVYPQSRYLSGAVRSFADRLIAHARPIRAARDRRTGSG